MQLLVSSHALSRRSGSVLVLALTALLSSLVLAGVPARAAAPVYLSGPDISHYQHDAGPVDFAKIAITAVALLLVFNSVALVDWTRQSRPGPVIAALGQPAERWHAAMERLGPAGLFERLHALARSFS